jgi:hypothetical protein
LGKNKAKNDAPAPETQEGKAPEQEAEEQRDHGLDGAAREALAIAKGRARALGFEVDEENYASSSAEATEKGWFGYSPTGPGENDAPERRSKSSRLGTQGEFGEEK